MLGVVSKVKAADCAIKYQERLFILTLLLCRMQLYKVFLRQKWYDSLSDVANRLSVLSVLQLKVGICLMYRRYI